MMHIDAAEKQGGAWLMGDVGYTWLCVAFGSACRSVSMSLRHLGVYIQ
jgi:hypothetical protein